MNERTVLEHVHELVEEERSLRATAPGAEAGERLGKIDEELDECWDLLRAKPQFDDPARARPLAADTVKAYVG
ncbi:MAG: DUF2630 family protein [Burkholderiaceae bacterium]